MAPADKEKQAKKKRNEANARGQQAKARFIATMTTGPPPGEDSTQNEPEIQYEEINMQSSNGTTDLGEIVAVLDDEHESERNDDDTGIMKEYMRAIMKRYQTEDSPSFQRDEPNGHIWLKEFLKDHGYWIRAECARLICGKLCIKCHEQAYYRDIRVWFPDVEGGLTCMPTCPTCKSSSNVRKHGYPSDHPGRRVTSFNTHYYIMSRQYLCTKCKEENDRQKKAAAGGTFKRTQYTTMGYHDEMLKNLPDDMLYKFPAVLSHRAALDRPLAQSLRPILDKGMRADGIADWILELHSLQYTLDYLSYELRLEKDLAFSNPAEEAPMFSKFDDRKQYNGAVPSSAYLTQMYKREHETIRPHLNQENKKISVRQLNIDASVKAPKKLSQVC
jgi:hypothetical protein